MSMAMLTLLQITEVLIVYFGMTVLLPALVLHEKLKGERFCIRFLMYYIIGNFYIINLVFLLQLLHISCRLTLLLGTVLPVVWVTVRGHNRMLKARSVQLTESIHRTLDGTMGGKLLVSRFFRGIGRKLAQGLHRMGKSILTNFFDWLGTGVCIVTVLWLFGRNLVWNMGYCASDIPVHNYWINAMSDNHIFVAGVYPQGFHCVIYYLHTVFGIYTFVMLRVFGLVSALMVNLALLAFLKACGRTKYTAYAAMLFYLLANVWNKDTYTRFYSALPQEFGMIFILPAITFLVLFLQEKKKQYLVFFAMSFSATLSIHFYNTMIAGIFCVAVAVGYAGVLFRRKVFFPVMAAGLLSVFVAVLPMGIAYATGTPLEGSLNWAMSIINGGSSESSQTTEEHVVYFDVDGQPLGEDGLAENSSGTESGTAASAEMGQSEEAEIQQKQPSFLERASLWAQVKWEKTVDLLYGLRDNMKVYVLNRVSSDTISVLLFFTVLLGVFGLVFLIPRKTRGYGGCLISMAVCMVFLYVMLMSAWFGLPALMDRSRCSIYLAYLLSAALGLCADGAVTLLAGWITTPLLANAISLGGIGVLAGVLVIGGYCKQPLYITALETNDAITCLTNILWENPRFHFTICSANDELRMVEEDGYHYELITFLREMEGEGQEDYLKIPTPKVYFFVEKIPGDYTESYEGSGRTVSEEGADRALPGGGGLSMYKGENRYIVMSRFYYWAKAFQELYPNEMKVYYESDAFVCYELTQNTYRLFDLSIDYGFNSKSY